uniref:Uncharacterized protein n=1 Tax=Pseudomonas phage Arace01 TaxID=3138526 RepID=A0AAU6VZL1_9VIRU
MKAVLTLSIEIDESGDPDIAEEILHENLDHLVDKAMQEALITGNSELLVVGYHSTIEVTK